MLDNGDYSVLAADTTRTTRFLLDAFAHSVLTDKLCFERTRLAVEKSTRLIDRSDVLIRSIRSGIVSSECAHASELELSVGRQNALEQHRFV